MRKSKKKLLLAYEFFPNPKNEWFGFSIEPLNLFDKSQYKYLFFDLKLEDLDCDLEVGYGNRDKTEWLRIRTSRLANRQWHQFKLEFNQNNCIDNLCTLLIFRSIGRFSRAKISVSEAYFTKGINA